MALFPLVLSVSTVKTACVHLNVQICVSKFNTEYLHKLISPPRVDALFPWEWIDIKSSAACVFLITFTCSSLAIRPAHLFPLLHSFGVCGFICGSIQQTTIWLCSLLNGSLFCVPPSLVFSGTAIVPRVSFSFHWSVRLVCNGLTSVTRLSLLPPHPFIWVWGVTLLLQRHAR